MCLTTTTKKNKALNLEVTAVGFDFKEKKLISGSNRGKVTIWDIKA